MVTLRTLFDDTRKLDRRIEKVISFDSADEEQLRREVTEYVATGNIEQSFMRLLDHLDEGMKGGGGEVGVWVSGFYGSGKSSFTKYLGFALDPLRIIDSKPFLEWLQNQFQSAPLKARLKTVAIQNPSTVIMIDLASAQLAGATLAEISSVLYWTVMQWAGYSKEKKVAYLQFMLERDGKMDAFEKRITAMAKGRTWKEIQNQPLVVQQLASRLANEFYPELFPSPDDFQKLRIDEAEKENERVQEMISLIQRKSGRPNIIFILDEVGQYIAARDNLILNLDGLAKNIKNLGKGKAWIIATAQQTLTEDDPRAQMNSAKLFKLNARFPIGIDLEASDIKEICYRRLLKKSAGGEHELKKLFDAHGQSLKFNTSLQNTKFFKSDLDLKSFCDLYPFLPQHFDILLALLGRLAKTSGGVGLRSAIKIIQDVLIDQSGLRAGQPLLADQEVGTLATTVTFYDTLRRDIQRSFRHIVEGVERVEKMFGANSVQLQVAKSIAVLQCLEDCPVSRENIAALLHAKVDAGSLLEVVKTTVDELLKEQAVHLSEIDGRLRFMSEAVAELEAEKTKIIVKTADTRQVLNTKVGEIFNPAPSVRLQGTRTVATGIKMAVGSLTVPIEGENEQVQTVVELVPEANYEKRKQERLLDSQNRTAANTVYLLGREDKDIDDILAEIVRCRGIYNQNRNKVAETEVADWLNAQWQRAENQTAALENLLKKALAPGSLVFRGKPKPVSELDSVLLAAVQKHLGDVAAEVFEKYSQAPIHAESNVAEKFLRTERLDKVASKDDPLGLVKKTGGKPGVDTTHAALVSIKDYLESHGQVDGRKLMEDFYAAPYGWSKDTTRYLVGALLVGGEIKLRIAGADVTVRGDAAIDGIKSTNNFNKIGIALRDSKPNPEAMLRAAERLMQLTGDTVLPHEDDISKAVIKNFPEFQRNYASLAAQLKNLGLSGLDRASNIQDSITEMIRGDASDATTWLGGETCALYDDLMWARSVNKAFDNGIETVIQKLRTYLIEIEALPSAGTPGKLRADTETLRAEAKTFLNGVDFYDRMPDLQNRSMQIETSVENAAKAMGSEQAQFLKTEVEALQSSPDWAKLGLEDQTRFSNKLDTLKITAAPGLAGLKKILGHQYTLSMELERIKSEVRQAARPPVTVQPTGNGDVLETTVALPTELASPDDVDRVIECIQPLKAKFQQYSKIKVKWQ